MDYQLAVDERTGERYLPVALRGADLLKNPLTNKGSAFTREERDAFQLRGMLPDSVSTLDEQVDRVYGQYVRKSPDLQKNIYLNGLMDRNETLFYRFVMDHLDETIPIIYTPTVAAACRHWSRIFRRARGIYVTPRDRGRIREALRCREAADRPVIVVTDNQRILGIGDQGAGGMGIPIGKLALYSVAAGIHPARCVPVSLDIGTDNPELLADPLYLGYREHRLLGDEYQSFVDEFVDAVNEVFPGALLQWEDFANHTSFVNLERYRDRILSFNDDIQGTAAMAVAGLDAVARHTGVRIRDHRVVIAGSGSAGIGIRDQVTAAMVAEGATPDAAQRAVFSFDSQGLLVEGRRDLAPEKRRLLVSRDTVAGWDVGGDRISMVDAVRNAGATVLIGVSGQASLFGEDLIRELARNAERPVVMPLSNPTSHTEVTPADALAWSEGRALVATGSPFPPVTANGVTHRIGQANNVFVFPGMGLGSLTVGAKRITTSMFLAAADALAGFVDSSLFKQGQLYPPITSVREVSRAVAGAVARTAIAEGEAGDVPDLERVLDDEMWWPEYVPYRAV
jgi:malic enzyme